MKQTLLIAALLTSPAMAQVATEDFEVGNTHLWSRDYITVGTHSATGGNPSGNIQATFSSGMTNLFAPMLMPSSMAHPWSGDFEAQGITRFTYDREVESGTSNFGAFPYLVLGFNNGTPNVLMDDVMVFVPTGDVFQFGAHPWTTFTVPIPSDSAVLPGGWFAEALPNSPSAGLDGNLLWDLVIHDVSYVSIAIDRPWGGFAWFGNHIINFDNFILDNTPDSIGTPFCSPMEANSTGSPAILTGSMSNPGGSGLHLEGFSGPPSEFGYFLVGTAMDDPGIVISGGRLCLSLVSPNAVGRYNVVGGPFNSIGQFDANGKLANLAGTSSTGFGFDVPTTVPIPGSPTIMTGSTWHFQLWFRDTPAAPGSSNFSNGLSILF